MNYAAASAKVRALLGGILNESDYDELISKGGLFSELISREKISE